MGLLHNWDLLAAHLTGEGDDGTGAGGGGDGGGAWVSTGALCDLFFFGWA